MLKIYKNYFCHAVKLEHFLVMTYYLNKMQCDCIISRPEYLLVMTNSLTNSSFLHVSAKTGLRIVIVGLYIFYMRYNRLCHNALISSRFKFILRDPFRRFV